MSEVINGTGMLMYRVTGDDPDFEYKAVGHATSHSLTVTMATRVTSTKDTGNYVSREAGRLDATGTADGLSVYDDDFGFEDMRQLVTDREPVLLVFTGSVEPVEPEDPEANVTPDLDNPYATGTFIITSFEQSAPDQDNTTYSVSYEGTGDFEIVIPT